MHNEAKRHAALLKLLAKSPLTEIRGIISPSNVGGSRHRGERSWSLHVPLIAWRTPDRPISRKELTARKPVAESAIARIQKRLPPYSLVRFRARLAETNPLRSPQALIVGPISQIRDAELARVARQLSAPVTFKHTTLGIFTLDRGVDWFEAAPKWGSSRIRLHLSPTDQPSLDKALAAAAALFKAQKSWHRRLTDYAAPRLLKEYNKVWRLEDEPSLSEPRLRRLMALESISIGPRGDFEFWLKDGDLFGGHSIVIRGSMKSGPKSVGLEG
jgi:hypothetical protein